MGVKRLKLAKGISDFVPTSMNFSQLDIEAAENEMAFNPSDNNLEIKRLENTMEYEEMVAQILFNLETREKLIFVFQLLRDGGYQIDHASFAKAIKISRRQYMRVLSIVRVKAHLLVIGYQRLKKRKRGTKVIKKT